MNSFADRISEIRKQQGLSQQQMADKAEITAKTYSKLERAESSPTVETLLKFSESFGMSTDYLLGRVDEQNVEPFVFEDKDRFLYRTKKGFACSEEHCEWRKDGYCPGKGCMKEAVRA